MNTIAAHHRDAPDADLGSTRRSPTALLTLTAAGAVVAVAIGAYGRAHDPTGRGVETFGFDAVLPMKAWFTSGAAALAVLQLGSACAMYGRLPGIRTGAWLAPVHRWAGTAAFVLTLPVAYHCLWALGFQGTGARQVVHGTLGCAFYGAFTTKMLALRSDRVPGWSLPLLGGMLVAILTGLWLTSSLWFFTNVGFPGT